MKSLSELRNIELELDRFRARTIAAAAFVVLAFGLLISRWVVLQVVRHDDLAAQAEANRIGVVPIVPNRGLIVDRNGVVLATNFPAYTLEITPSKVDDVEATIDEIAKVIEVTPRDRRRFKRLTEESKNFESLPIRTKLTDEEVARFVAQRFRFPGVEIKARLFRSYPHGELASHLIGYIGRINQEEKKNISDNWSDDDQANYRGTEYIGKLGLEQSYENELHGTTGFEQVETAASGRAVRQLARKPATPGNTLSLSIDIRLQALVEALYGDRRGALVAIDPRNGEVLAFASKPTFDPNLFVDGIDPENWKELNESIDKPLLNRAIRGTYAPGSTFKPYMALAALATGKRTPQWAMHDPAVYVFGNHTFHDDVPQGHGYVDMYASIVKSCDIYYFMLANDLGVDTIASFMRPFGFGEPTGIDLEGELRGVLPSTEWKRKAYRKPEQQRWYAGETISLGIGQGYNNFTITQLAKALTILSTGGQRHTPHLVRDIVDSATGERHPVVPEAQDPLPLNPAFVEVIRNAMQGVIKEGTAASAFVGVDYLAAGKTGTAQVVALKANEKYNAAKVAEHLRDNALFIAFAPADHPTIALAMVLENAGFGGANAAPIARRVLDYWIDGLYPTDKDIAAVQAASATAPVEPPVPVAQARNVRLGTESATEEEAAASAADAPPSDAALGNALAPLPMPGAGASTGASSAAAAAAAPAPAATSTSAATPAAAGSLSASSASAVRAVAPVPATSSARLAAHEAAQRNAGPGTLPGGDVGSASAVPLRNRVHATPGPGAGPHGASAATGAHAASGAASASGHKPHSLPHAGTSLARRLAPFAPSGARADAAKGAHGTSAASASQPHSREEPAR
ncbi:MAG TPA: penicillin-binding protein 2 [Burkholderiaceae bacterium]|nr:penicillin-binding protein 2 [Burkholderiaceae bacterium]